MQYAVVIEETDTGFSAYVPDLPGCVAAAATRPEVEALIESALQAHLDLLREIGDPIPKPTTGTHLVEVA